MNLTKESVQNFGISCKCNTFSQGARSPIEMQVNSMLSYFSTFELPKQIHAEVFEFTAEYSGPAIGI